MFVFTISKAQTIPNAGFENWTSKGSYNNPDLWSCLNDITTTMSAYTCMKGTPGNPGTSYIKLVSTNVTGLGVVPGISVSGKIDPVTMQPKSGFPFNQRPAKLTGSWQHMIYGSSQGFIDIQLTRWDVATSSRKIIASTHQNLSGMAMSWASFNISLTYMDGSTPDSCIITLAASGSAPTANDYLYIDNLAFTGSVAAISEVFSDKIISLYPNPASETLVIDLSALDHKNVSFKVFDIQGKVVMEIQNANVASKIQLNVANLPKGNYVLNVISKDRTFFRKFIKE